MTKRLLLSLTVITMALAAVAGATAAYFTDGVVLGSAETPNVFATGTVKIGDSINFPIVLENLTPGKEVSVNNLGVKYEGSIRADLYIGARGTSEQEDPQFLADKLYIWIYKNDTTEVVWQGYVSGLSEQWRKIATDIGKSSQIYDLKFRLDASTGNDKQDQINNDTQILIYAVQTGGSKPTTIPYLTVGDNWY